MKFTIVSLSRITKTRSLAVEKNVRSVTRTTHKFYILVLHKKTESIDRSSVSMDVNVLDAIRHRYCRHHHRRLGLFMRRCTSCAMNIFCIFFVCILNLAGSVCYLLCERVSGCADAGRCARCDCGQCCFSDNLCPPRCCPHVQILTRGIHLDQRQRTLHSPTLHSLLKLPKSS